MNFTELIVKMNSKALNYAGLVVLFPVCLLVLFGLFSALLSFVLLFYVPSKPGHDVPTSWAEHFPVLVVDPSKPKEPILVYSDDLKTFSSVRKLVPYYSDGLNAENKKLAVINGSQMYSQLKGLVVPRTSGFRADIDEFGISSFRRINNNNQAQNEFLLKLSILDPEGVWSKNLLVWYTVEQDSIILSDVSLEVAGTEFLVSFFVAFVFSIFLYAYLFGRLKRKFATTIG